MNDLQQYFEDRKQFVELLEAVGISTLKEFSAIDPFTVLPELHQAKPDTETGDGNTRGSRVQGMGGPGPHCSQGGKPGQHYPGRRLHPAARHSCEHDGENGRNT